MENKELQKIDPHYEVVQILGGQLKNRINQMRASEKITEAQWHEAEELLDKIIEVWPKEPSHRIR